MRFAAPEFLWLLGLLPLAAAAAWINHALRERALRRFAGGEAYASRFTGDRCRNRRAIKMLLLYLAWIALPLALARPQWGSSVEQITRRGGDVVLVLDSSLSMSAEDLAPNRLDHAKHSIETLLDGIEGDRVALVTFAGQAQLNCPLTVDHGAVRLFLEAVDPKAVPLGGTALADALGLALRALTLDGAASDRGRAVVVYSDGEDHEGGVDEILESLARAGIPVHTVGCGTTRGAPIPLRDAAGILSGYKKDGEGKVVTTRLEDALLEQVALGTDGRYFRATTGETEVEQLARVLSGLEAGEFGSTLRVRYEERFQLPLMAAWLALCGEALLGDRRRRRAEARRREAA